MRDEDDRFMRARPLLREKRFQTLAPSAKRAERIADADAPVGAGDDPPLLDSVWAVAECGFQNAGKTVVVDALELFIFEGLGINAAALETGEQVILSDQTEILWFDGVAELLESCEKPLDGGAPGLSAVAKERGERGPSQAGLVEHPLLLC